MSNRPRPVVAVTPTAISGSTICERQSILKMTNPISGSASLPLKFGSAVHEAYRALAERSRKTWLENEMPLEKQIISDADYIMKETLELVKETDPNWYLDILRDAPLMKTWLLSWSLARKDDFDNFMNITNDRVTAISFALPLTEQNLESKKYGLYGRADQVYFRPASNSEEDVTVSVCDLKTDERITSYLNENSHIIQLACYAVMVSETFGRKCNEVSILYVKNQETRTVPVTDNLISQLADAIAAYHENISSPNLPPVLTGMEADIRCPRCPWKKICYRRAELDGSM